jgi:hypothetical protein
MCARSACTGSSSTTAARETLPDPAVADDAESLARGAQVGQAQDRRHCRLARAVRVVEHVLAARVVGGDRREDQEPRLLHRSQARDAGGGLLRHALEPLRELGTVLDDSPGQLCAVVDHDLRAGLGDVQQVGRELLRRRTVMRVHLDPATHERGADGILRGESIAPGGNHVGARICEQRRQVGGLRLEVHDERNALPAQRSVRQAVTRKLVEDRRVARDPLDLPLALVGERDIRDPRPALSISHSHRRRLYRPGYLQRSRRIA